MRRLILLAVLASVALTGSFSPGIASAEPGDLDASFGVNGRVKLGHGFAPTAVVSADDDGAVVAGLVTGGDDASSDWVRLREVTADGGLDPDFGENGSITIGADGRSAYTGSLDVDSAGRVVVGASRIHADDDGFSVFRFTRTGEPDPTFGNNGVAIYGDADHPPELGVTPDSAGGILFLQDGTLRRLSPDGSTDTNFGGDGAVELFAGYSGVDPSDISLPVVGDDGSITVAADQQLASNPPLFDVLLQRFDAPGSPDLGFGSSGDGVTDLQNLSPDRLRTYAVDAAGNVILVADGVGKVFANGEVDFGFDYGGPQADAVAVDSLDRPLLTFSGRPDGGYPITRGIERLGQDGEADAGYGEGGVSYAFGGRADAVVSGSQRSDLSAGPDGSAYSYGFTHGRSVLLRWSGADGPPDLDGDLVDDPEDRCPWLAGRLVRQGCPLVRGEATPKWVSPRGVRGVFESTAPTCGEGRALRLMRRVSGPDVLVGKTRLKQHGWSIRARMGSGSYYTLVPAVDRGKHGFCARVRSRFDLAVS